MEINDIFENNRRWAAAKMADDPDFFSRLAGGQSPSMLYIGCSDSRVTAEEVMGVCPGDVFVMRNIANIVSSTDMSAMSVIHYAVTSLKVRHVVICGHYCCGGVEAAMNPEEGGILNPWLRTIRDVYRLHQTELDAIDDRTARLRRLIELNVQEQCVNIIKTPDIQRAWKEGRTEVHGWVFDIETGLIRDLEIDFDSILKRIMKIYRTI